MRRLLAPVLLLVVALPLLAATHETQTVEVVQVPVYVSTAHGAVTGLTRDNFELFVNGKRQPFDYFDVIDFAKAEPAPAATARPDPRQRRLYVLVFDLYYAAPNSLHRAQRAAKALLAQAGPSDVYAIATYSSRRGIDVIVPFTKDRGAIEHAIGALRASVDADPLRLHFGPSEALPVERAFDLDVPRGTPVSSTFLEMVVDRQRFAVADQIGALGLLAERLAPIEGQKHVVLLSAGYASLLLHGVDTRPNMQPAFVDQMMPTPRRPEAFGANGQALMDLRVMIKQYANAEVFLDAVDTAGLRHTWTVGENESLYALTRDTGGTVVDNRNNLTEALQTLTDRQRVVYVLGFHNRDARRKENSIQVRLRNVDGHPDVRYRQAFSPIAPAASPDNGLRLADILLNDTPQNGVDVSAAAKGRTVTVSIPARALLAQIDDKKAQAEAMIYIFSGPRVVATDVKRIDIDNERAKAAGNEAIRFEQTFELPPGDYAAKVLVRLGDALGFARTDFTVE